MKLGSILVSLVVVILLLKSKKLNSSVFCCAFFAKNKMVKEVTYVY